MMVEGNVQAARMELKDTYRLKTSDVRNAMMEKSAATGCTAMITPSKLAIPLPPLKPMYTGKICPSTATIPSPNMFSIDWSFAM